MLFFSQLIQVFLLFFKYFIRYNKHVLKCDVNRCSFRDESNQFVSNDFFENLTFVSFSTWISSGRSSDSYFIWTIFHVVIYLNCFSSSCFFQMFDQIFLSSASVLPLIWVCFQSNPSIFFVVFRILYHIDYTWHQISDHTDQTWLLLWS